MKKVLVLMGLAVAACSGNRHEAAPVIMNGAGPGGIQAAPLAPGTVPPMNAPENVGAGG